MLNIASKVYSDFVQEKQEKSYFAQKMLTVKKGKAKPNPSSGGTDRPSIQHLWPSNSNL